MPTDTTEEVTPVEGPNTILRRRMRIRWAITAWTLHKKGDILKQRTLFEVSGEK